MAENLATITPFLRWAGGKIKIISTIKNFLPDDYQSRKYWEPFLGAGSLFFHIQPKKGTISDLNQRLIDCYNCIKENPLTVSRSLNDLQKYNSENFYYITRNRFNSSKKSFSQAARFIFLNKTCYNGLFRVNSNGHFNVPYGQIQEPALPTFEELKKISLSLSKVNIVASSYEKIIRNVKKNDFIYLDPPYPPLSKTSYFTHYTKDSFSLEKHQELATLSNNLTKKGCLVLITNADTKDIRKMYKGWSITKTEVTRWISCKKERIKVNELIIKNY